MMLHEFFQQAEARAVRCRERRGQAWFNHLFEIRPDLAEKVRGTELDPYYLIDNQESTQEVRRKFTQFLTDNWEQG